MSFFNWIFNWIFFIVYAQLVITIIFCLHKNKNIFALFIIFAINVFLFMFAPFLYFGLCGDVSNCRFSLTAHLPIIGIYIPFFIISILSVLTGMDYLKFYIRLKQKMLLHIIISVLTICLATINVLILSFFLAYILPWIFN